MKKINKILLSVSFVAIAVVVFFIGQDRNMANIIISDNVEALTEDECNATLSKEYTHPYKYGSSFEFYSYYNMMRDTPFCSNWTTVDFIPNGNECYEVVESPL